MLAAVVVTYYPQDCIIENIKSYIDCVDIVYIVDNSNVSNESVFSIFPKNKLKYIPNLNNLGIAKALNIGCSLAIQDSYRWVLTMDQDSKFLNLNNNIVKYLKDNSDGKNAIFYPQYEIDGVIYDRYIKEDGVPIVVMTSGNIIDLDIYLKVKGFEDKLFIDYVDIDYCLKLKKFGYNILSLPDTTLQHELGVSKHVSFLFINGIVTNHSSLRRYYITRNRLLMMKRYKEIFPAFYRTEIKVFFNDMIKIVLFEDKKISKFRSIIKGYLDYRKNKYGKVDLIIKD